MISNTEKSTFVTSLAWVFIVLSGLMTMITLAQNIMIGLVFSPPSISEMRNASGSEEIPEIFIFLISNIKYFFLGAFIMAFATLSSSIALLRRKNWGRIIFIVILLLGIVWNIFGVIAQFTFLPHVFQERNAAANDSIFQVIRVFTAIFATVVCCLFGWLISKLSSDKIKSEFSY